MVSRLFHCVLQVCIGLRWLRRNDNDSIGDDDRRGVAGLAPGHRYNGSNPFVRPQQRLLLGQQQNAEQQLGALPAALKCARADVVTHLKGGNSSKSDEAKRTRHDADGGQAPEEANALA